MILSAAQIKPIKGDTESNIKRHYDLIELAAKNNVDLIVFPEMSLTGYEREEASKLAFTENDPRINILKELAALHNMIIVAGAPVKIKDKLCIGSFIFLPDGTTSIYTKQYLHSGEENFFVPNSEFNPVILSGNERISVAICADITNPVHSANAGNNKTTLYVASLFYTPAGISEAYKQLSSYAQKYGMNILMANYGGPSYNLQSGGQSAFWSKNGLLVGNMDENTSGLLIIEDSKGEWRVRTISND
jgi:predicted amidohydrolase